MSLRAGIVGCGGISRSHAKAYRHLPDVSLVALCDIDKERLRLLAADHDISACYTDYRNMFNSEKLDLVSVCTHAPLHAPVTFAAAEAGIDVLCEKPLSLDLENADQMVKKCQDAGVRLAVSHQHRFMPVFRLAKEWIDSGRIGALRSIREVGKGREAGFELMEMGVHYFDELDFFMGNISWVHAQVSFKDHEVDVDDIMYSNELCESDRRDNGIVAGDTMLIQLGSEAGTSGLIELYKRPNRQNWIAGPHILGDEGQLMIKASPEANVDVLWYCPNDISLAADTPAWKPIPVPIESLMINGQSWPARSSIWSVLDMVTAIREDRQPELGEYRALTSLECVSAVYESHFRGRRISLPMNDRRHPLRKRRPDLDVVIK